MQPDRFLDRRHLWPVFRATNIYRLVLAALLLTAFAIDQQNRLFGKQDPRLFLGGAAIYMALAIIAIAGSFWRRPRLMVQAHLQLLADLAALTIMINASPQSEQSAHATIAASGILLCRSVRLCSGRHGFFPALRFLAVRPLADRWRWRRGTSHWAGLLEQIGNATDDWVRIGVLGAVLFIAAGLTYTLADRARRSEALARQRTSELLDVAELNQGIIRHLQNGVVVVDAAGQIQLLNDTAQSLLDAPPVPPGIPLDVLSPLLAQRLADWRSGNALDSPAFRPAERRRN